MKKRELKTLIKNFVPQFGNVNHIRALEIISKMKKRDALLLERRQKNMKMDEEIMELEEELNIDERNLEFLITGK